MKLAIVVPRYGQDIDAGATLQARCIAEHLVRRAEIEVLTTCARDAATWRNELPSGTDRVNGVAVHRFEVARARDARRLGPLQERVFQQRHSAADELAWLDAEGPASPKLLAHLAHAQSVHDFFLFFGYRPWLSYHGIRAVAPKALLVPAVEADPAIGLSVFGPIFRGVRALLYNSPEERIRIQAVSGNQDVPGLVVGVGSDMPPRQAQPGRFRAKFDVRVPFAVCMNRSRQDEGDRQVVAYFERYSQRWPSGLMLVLAGPSLPEIPKHPRIRQLGSLDDPDRFDAIAAADLLIVPSSHEHPSMAALEAWTLGRPVLSNGRCDALKGQSIRGNAGLYYEGYAEFAESLRAIHTNPWLSNALGRSGQQFYREHCDWPIIEQKYMTMLDRLARDRAPRPLEPMPGWFARRRRILPSADEVVDTLPEGPAVEEGPDGPAPRLTRTVPAPSESRLPRLESNQIPPRRPERRYSHGPRHSRRRSPRSRSS